MYCQNICVLRPVKLFSRLMPNYATLSDAIIQHYATLYTPRRYIAAYSPPYRRERPFFAAITVHNLIGI